MPKVRLSNIASAQFREIHRDVMAHRHTYYWLKGGRGSTKSSFISEELPLLMLKNPLCHAVVLRKVGNTIKHSVFGSYTAEGETVTPLDDHILDISGGSGNAAKISASGFIDALQLLGDAQGDLTAVAMHSATKAYLKKQNLITTERDSTDVEFDVYQGRRVIVDDGCPVSEGVYTTYLFGQGAVAFGEGSPEGFVQTETDRDKKYGSGIDYLINRHTFILHPRGIKWTDTVRTNVESPSRAELANAKNWQRVYESKQIRLVAFKHKIG
ncbi:major capsid protein [Anaerovibrio lipolyticus]|uniref:major capsid protein n=1 Tax=Anaerovibrio lipolyticus TaxID=82374 RepID=UPI0026EC5418|nr:major capsid protein [Anaerovibrio lipolyticus]